MTRMEDSKIISLFFERSEQDLEELDNIRLCGQGLRTEGEVCFFAAEILFRLSSAVIHTVPASASFPALL